MAKVPSGKFSENANSKQVKAKFKDSQANEWRVHASVRAWAKGKAGNNNN